jgi:hypothetical protein
MQSQSEEIVQQYPSLDLGSVYAVLAYLLKHRTQVDAYLTQRAVVGERIRAENERRFPASGIRDRLLRRPKPA